MKNKKFCILIFIFVLIAGVVLCSACGDNKAKDEVVNETAIVPIDKTIVSEGAFCNMSNGISVKELASIENPDGSMAFGITLATSADYSSAYYSRMLDINAIDGDIVRFEVIADDSHGTDSVIFSLIDAYDETNYFSVKFDVSSVNEAWGNISVKSAKGSSYYGADNYKNTGYSSGVSYFWNNFKGINNQNVLHKAFNFSYNSEENAVYTYTDDFTKILVMDLDNGQVFNDDTRFKGFTTGAAYLKIEFGKLVNNGAILIEQIGQISFDKKFDRTTPNDIIRFQKADCELFDGVKGVSYPLPVPVVDDFLFGKIFYDVKVTNAENKEIMVDNYKFTPESRGEYKITYKTSDNFGNEIEKIFNLDVNDEPYDINIDFAEDVLYICDEISLPEISVSGGNGNLVVSKEYYYKDEKVLSDELYLDAVSPLRAKVIVTDALGNTKTQIKLYQVTPKSVISIDGTVPLAVLKGKELKLAEFSAYDYVGNSELEKSIYVNGQKIALDSMKYQVSGNVGEELQIVYYGGKGTDKECFKEFKTKIIDPDSENIAKYFIFDENEFTASSNDTYAVFKSLKKTDESVISYPFALSAELLEIRIDYDANSRYKYTDVILSDYIDGTVVDFRILYKNDNFALLLRDEYGNFSREVMATSSMKDANSFSVYYDNARKALLDYRFNFIVNLEYSPDGSVFNGLKNCGAYLSFRLNGLKEGATFLLNKLSNQYLGRMDGRGDVTGPVITVVGEFDSRANVGDNIVFPKTYGFDVLTENPCEVFLTVYDPEGEELCYDESLNQSLNFSIDKIGVYIFSLFARDGNGVRTFKEYTLEVKDISAPVVRINAEDIITVSKGKEVSLPGATVTDDYSSESEIEKWILIKLPDAKYALLSFNGRYTFEKEGVYTVSYYAKDKAGNVSMRNIVFNVK